MEVKGEVKKKAGKEREEERRAELKRKELEEDDKDDEDEERALKAAKQTRIELSRQCPYLDTIDRSLPKTPRLIITENEMCFQGSS